jgi:hypothetical protein
MNVIRKEKAFGHVTKDLTSIEIFVGREVGEKLPPFFFGDVTGMVPFTNGPISEITIDNIKERKPYEGAKR